jgi:hypothetical protein
MIKVISKKYSNLTMTPKGCFASTSFFKGEYITDEIDFVKIWDVEGVRSNLTVGNNTLIGAVLGGIVGASAAAILSNNCTTICCTIYLRNKNYFEVTTNKKDLIKFLLKFVCKGRKYYVQGRAI